MSRDPSPIPFEATDLTGARILVLAAHPDDEALGAAGTLALNAAKAEAIRIWIATDGTGQEGVAPEEADEYGRRRREESVQAARALGVEAPRFGGLADRGLPADSERLQSVIRAELDDFEPDLILCPSPAEIHPDHRALFASR